jgi:hypothetical protein
MLMLLLLLLFIGTPEIGLSGMSIGHDCFIH